MEKYSDTYKNEQTGRERAAVWKVECKGAVVSAGLFTRRRHIHTCRTVAMEIKTWNSQLVDTPIKNQVTMLLLHVKQAHTYFYMEGDRLLEQFSFMLAIKCFTFGDRELALPFKALPALLQDLSL